VVSPGAAGERLIEVSTRRFAQNVTIETPGFVPDDNGFHLAPGQRRRIVLRARDARPSFARDIASALNADSVAHFELR
jgi:beta-mannosidase